MNSHDPRFDALAAAYALDALDDLERAAFERHLGDCDECSAEVAAHREAAGWLAEVSSVTPPTHVRESVLSSIANEPVPSGAATPATRRSRRWFDTRVLGGVAAAVIIAVAAIVVTRPSDEPVTVDLVLASSDAETWTLAGAPGEIDIVWSPSRDHVAVVGEDVSSPIAGRSFQLWMVHDDGVSSAGVLELNADRVWFVHDTPDALATGWLVSDEPEGGSPEPTGDIVFSRKP